MPSRERPDQQDNCSHGQYERENEAECHITFGQTTRDCADASCLLLGYFSQGIENRDNDWNGQSPREDCSPNVPLSLAVVAGTILHRGRRDCHRGRRKSSVLASSSICKMGCSHFSIGQRAFLNFVLDFRVPVGELDQGREQVYCGRRITRHLAIQVTRRHNLIKLREVHHGFPGHYFTLGIGTSCIGDSSELNDAPSHRFEHSADSSACTKFPPN